MFFKPVLRAVITLLISISALQAVAQPVLPDMVGATDKGINVLSWMCQYDGIKSIAVQRSTDSVFNYATIGYVKNLKKGPQAYIDGHPDPGKNWYRLCIVFNSDLVWYSNRINIYIDSATLLNKQVLPPNDSLQKYAVGIKLDTTIVTQANSNVGSNVTSTITNNTNTNTNTTNNTKPNTTVVTATTQPATTQTAAIDTVKQVVAKLTINIPEPEELDQYTYIKSQYVFTNPFTGHVNIEIPKESGYHFYALKFFNLDDVPVLDVPRFTETEVIIDKRNFKKKGIYKFILKKDREKLEEGYITIY